MMPDREKVIKEFEHLLNAAKGNYQDFVDLTVDGGDEILAMMKEQEAKQGKWERQYSRPGVFANLFWWCSVCGQPTRYNDAGIFYQYCPHCGAKLEPCKET